MQQIQSIEGTLAQSQQAAEQGLEGFLSISHGFLPVEAPLLELSSPLGVLDQIAASLPDLVETGQVNTVLNDLGELDVSERGGPARELKRVASLLGVFAHTALREQIMRNQSRRETDPDPTAIPEPILAPWKQVCQRLGRPGPGMTYSDLILYNWTLQDPQKPREVENFALVTPVYGTEEERIFYMTMAEMHALATPMVGATLSLESALKQHDDSRIQQALIDIQSALNAMTYDALLKIDPNPYSALHVDHLIWAKTVAPFAFPIIENELGLSGGGSPIFHVLDMLFQRQSFESQIGQELLHLRQWMPSHLQHYLEQVHDLNLPNYIQLHASKELKGVYHQTLEAYTGERGWLGLHRLKVYGFMEVGFKAGRSQTNGGFEGEVKSRAWEDLDDSINDSRLERYPKSKPSRCPFANHKKAQSTLRSGQEHVQNVVLNIQGEGVRYEAGDRVGVFPAQSPELVQKTLKALNATGDESLRLTQAWRHLLSQITGYEVPAQFPLKHFLQYAKLRPLLRPVGKAIYAITRSPKLHEMLEERQEDQAELWEIFEQLKAEYHDVTRFWKAEPWEAESLARLVPPERFRIYSISSSQENAPDELHLTIGRLGFDSAGFDEPEMRQRKGTASHFITSEPEHPIPVQIVRPSRFRLPKDPARPIVMFAGGSGISPFRAFWQARQTAEGDNWLFLGTKSVRDLYYHDELESESVSHGLKVRVAFSREDAQVALNTETQKLEVVPGQRGYIDQAILNNAEALWACLEAQAEGGQEGYFYICGQTRFAHTVIEGLKAVLTNKLGAQAAEERFRHLVAQGRFMMDIFTTFAPADSPGVLPYQEYHASEVLSHNNPKSGYWMVLNGFVYDLSEFMYLHPGGERLIMTNAGLDATRSYEKVEHHLNSEVHAMLDLYKIGKIKRLHFAEHWGIAIHPHPTQKTLETAAVKASSVVYLTLHDLYTTWMNYIYQLVEIENAMQNNLSLRRSQVTLSDSPNQLNFVKANLLLECHQMFVNDYLPQLTGPNLEHLWAMTIGLCDPDARVHYLSERLASIQEIYPTEALKAKEQNWIHALNDIENEDQRLYLSQELMGLHQAKLRFLRTLKSRLTVGLKAFETYESEVLQKGRQDLLEALLSVPTVLEIFYQDLDLTF